MTCVSWIKTEIMVGPETDAQFLGSIPREVDREEEKERGDKKGRKRFLMLSNMVHF